MRQSVSSPDTSMEEEEMQEAEEVHMRDLLGNEEEDLEEAASQLMPDDLVDQLVGEINTAEQREGLKQGSGLAKLWEDQSLFTQELSQAQTEKQENPSQTKGYQGGRCDSDQQLLHQLQGKASAGTVPKQVVTLEEINVEEVTLQEEMNVEKVETQKEEVPLTPTEAAPAEIELETSLHLELETTFQSDVGDDDMPSQELQEALEIAEAITPVKPHSVPGVLSTPGQDLESKKAAMFCTPSHGVPPSSMMTTSTPDHARKVLEPDEDGNLNNTAGSNAFSADGLFMDL